MKLETLTPQQEALIPVVKNEWIKLALLDGDEFDDEQARRSLEWLYALANKKKPITILVDSPLAMQYAANILAHTKGAQVRDQVWDQVRDQVWAQVEDQVWAQVEAQVRDQVGAQVGAQVRAQVEAQVEDQVWAQVRAQVRAQVEDQVRDQVRDQVWAQVEDQVWAQVEDQVRDQVRAQVRAQVEAQVEDQVRDQVRAQVEAQVEDQVWGQVRAQVWDQVGAQVRDQKLTTYTENYTGLGWDSGWVSFYDFFERIGILSHKQFKEYRKMLKSGIFMTILFENVAIACRRPSAIRRNDAHLLSYDHGPAVEWRDGYKLWFLDGVAFTENEWTKITNQKFTLETLGKAGMGSDKSAIALKYAKPDVLLEGVKAKLIHTGIKGTRLYEVKNFYDTGKTQYCIRMKHPSLKTEYIEWVEPAIGEQRNADLCQANAFGVPLEDYLLSVEA